MDETITTEITCDNCGAEFVIQHHVTEDDISYCPFCGEDIIFEDLDDEEDLEEFEDDWTDDEDL